MEKELVTSPIELLKDYIEDNDIEKPSIEEDDFTEAKKDFIKLSELYVNYFNQFRKDFKNLKNAERIIESNLFIASELISLTLDYNNGKSFSSVRIKEEIKSYVKSKYYNILDFIDLYIEVYSE